MAKYAYNINKENKILEVQKQFPGGLKTVDTDDALGKVFLRKAENVSLSEFSFLEKRYGTYIKEEFKFEPGDEPNFNNPIQGYFEFTRDDGEVDKLLFIGGTAFVKTFDSEVFVRKTLYLTEPDFDYPDPFIYFQVIGGELLNLTESVSGEGSIVLIGNLSRDEERFETLFETGTIQLTGDITGLSDFDGSLSSTATINLTGNIVITAENSGPLVSGLNFTTVFEGKGVLNTIRVKSTSPVPIVLPMTWEITARNYNESGTTNYNRDNFTIVRDDVPGIVEDAFGITDSNITFSIQDSFMSGGSIYVLDGVTTTHGNLITLGVNQFTVENIEDDVDITIEYKEQTSEV